jgi:hypothetical protein
MFQTQPTVDTFTKKRRLPPMFSVLLMAVVLVTAVAFSFTTVADAATTGSVVPISPPGFKAPASADLSQLLGKDPTVHIETLKLPATSCSAKELARSTGKCQILHYWKTGATRLPLSRGTQVISASGGYWYWWAWDQICSSNDPGTHDGCTYWSFTMTEDGVANGSHVWQWNHGCTAGGFFGSVDGQWCGYLYNGGGWPNYAMQFGLNGKACLITAWGTGCYNHGMRRWINDYGNRSTFYSW